MKHIEIPIGKILAIGTGIIGTGISSYVGKKIRGDKSKKQTLPNMIIQGVTCSAMEAAFITYAERLWMANHLNTTVSIMGTADYDTECVIEFDDIIDNYSYDEINDDEAIELLCTAARKYHQKVSTCTMIDIISKIYDTTVTKYMIFADYKGLCSLLLTLQRPSSLISQIYTGQEEPHEACKLIGAMGELYLLALTLPDGGEIARRINRCRYVQYKSLDDIRYICNSCELMVANASPWNSNPDLNSWIPNDYPCPNRMGVALALVALAVHTPINVDVYTARDIYRKTKTENPPGYLLFVDAFPTLSKNFRKVILDENNPDE